MAENPGNEKLVGVLRRLGYFSLIIYPGILVAVGMSGDAGGMFLPVMAIVLALIYGAMPFVCSSISKKQLKAGNERAALVISAIPFTVFLLYFLFLVMKL